MTPTVVFVLGIAVTGLTCLLVLGYLRLTLKKILIDLCGTEDRAGFWTAFSNVTLILVPTIVAMHYRPEVGQNLPLVFQLGSQLEWALIGLASSVVVLGMVLALFITGARSGTTAQASTGRQSRPA